MKEEWKKIDGYKGIYSVSNYGGILNNKTGRALAVNYGCRLPSVGLSVNGTQKWVPVCLLVPEHLLIIQTIIFMCGLLTVIKGIILQKIWNGFMRRTIEEVTK